MNFNNDVNYEGFFHLEEALDQGKPAGLKHFGDWPTIYEGLSQLPPKVQKSWFDFDHFYSDNSFNQALEIVFKHHKTRSLFDVGGNTGRWAELCVGYDDKVEVTILDLPQQLEMMHKAVAGKKGSERIKGHAIDMDKKRGVSIGSAA
jgi:O-methyltransferase.